MNKNFSGGFHREFNCNFETLELWMKVHIALIRELVELMYTQYLQVPKTCWLMKPCMCVTRPFSGTSTRKSGA